MFPYKFGFIGAGNMGFAIMKGLVQSFQPEDIIFYEKNEQRAEDVLLGPKRQTVVLPVRILPGL